MDAERYRELRTQARRLTRRAADAEDLLQDALLAGLAAGRDDPAWLAGTLRNLAAMRVRGDVRRRARDADWGEATTKAVAPREASAMDTAFLQALPPAARRVAVLALHGLDPDEIRWILALSPTAFRQRLTSIRKALGTLPPAQRAEALALAYVRDPARSVDLAFGLIRRALKAALLSKDGLATHDPDGHLLVLRAPAHASPRRGN